VASRAEPGNVVATVAGRPILVDHLDAREAQARRGRMARHLPPPGAPAADWLRRWLVQELVTESVLAHEAGAAGDDDGAARQDLSPADRARLFAEVTRQVVVDERKVRAYYRRNPDLFQRGEVRRIRHVLHADERDARREAERARRTNRGPRGGRAWELRRGDFGGAFGAAVFVADVGDVIGPIRSELGWHTARLEAIRPARRLPLAAVRASIEAELLAAERLRAFEQWLDRRRRELVVIEPGYEHPSHPVNGTHRHRH
jgi:[acyl-carrier-protein] S-malonyltransferase